MIPNWSCEGQIPLQRRQSIFFAIVVFSSIAFMLQLRSHFSQD